MEKESEKGNVLMDAVFDIISAKENIHLSGATEQERSEVLIEAFKMVPEGKTALFIAKDGNTRKEKSVKINCTILESVGFLILRRNYSQVYGKNNKQFRYINAELRGLGMDDSEQFQASQKIDSALVQLRRNMAENTEEETMKFINSRYVEAVMNIREEIIDYNISCDNKGELIADDIDMLEIPVMAGYDFPHYDYLFLDDISNIHPLEYEFIVMLSFLSEETQGGYVIFSGNSPLTEKFCQKTQAKEINLDAYNEANT